MAARKPMIGPKPARDKLDSLVKAALLQPMTDAQLAEQRVSFAYGNAPESDYISKDSVRKAINSFRLQQAM
jgi:hypothetical protein